MKKYKLTEETKDFEGSTLYRIQALKDFGDVKKGDLGGWIEREDNLSQSGDCWVYDNARVFGDAQVFGNARVYDNAWVAGNARVFDNARVCDNAKIFDDALIYDNAEVGDDAKVSGDANIYGSARVSDKARVFGDATVCGKVLVSGNAQLCGKYKYKQGYFIGGDDSGKITDITDKTGSTYWKHQYVLGNYRIEPIQGNQQENQEDLIEIDGKKFSKETIKEALKKYIE